jgi:hypothetical protein
MLERMDVMEHDLGKSVRLKAISIVSRVKGRSD